MNIGGGITIGGGVTLTVPASGGGGGGGGGPAADITGTAAIEFANGSYGAANGAIAGFGALSSTPTSVQFFQYNGTFSTTFMMFIQGTSSGLNISGTDIDGSTSVSVTCNGVTVTSTGAPVDMGSAYLRFEFTGDPFGIIAATGTTLPFSVTLL